MRFVNLHRCHDFPYSPYVGVIELGPSNLVAVWGKPNGSRVRQNLKYVI